MGGCCNKRGVLTVPYKRSHSLGLRKNSIFIDEFCKQDDYKKKYEFISILGNGGFGKVRLYRDKLAKNLKFAIKTIKKDFLNPHNIASLVEEVKILRELDHPNIVKYFETYEDDLYIHIVMEYIPGDNLFKVVTNRKYNQFNERNAAEIMKCLLKAIMFLHNMNIVHRDIKPENILFSLPGSYESLKLIDFGLSATKTQIKDKYRVGSPYYMAPEMINRNFTFKSDCWSIGVILFEMMTGKHPFDGKTQEEIFERIQRGEYDLHLLEKQKCSEEVKDLIKKLIVLNPPERLSVQKALEHPWLKIFVEKEKKLNTVIDKAIIDSLKTFPNSNPLEKEIMFYLAKISNEKEIQKLKLAFLTIDKDNTGTIEIEEMFQIFEEMGIKREKVFLIVYF